MIHLELQFMKIINLDIYHIFKFKFKFNFYLCIMMKTICIDDSNIMEDITNIVLNFTLFKNRMNDLQFLEKDDKIIIWENKIYKESMPTILQPITRPLFGQNRHTIKIYLHNEFTEFIKLLHKISNLYSIIPETYKLFLQLNDVRDRIIKFIELISPGLLIIKNVYESSPPNINATLDPILYHLRNFIDKYRNKKKKYN